MTQLTTELNLNVPESHRQLRMRLSYADECRQRLQQLVIIATGLHSHMDKAGQQELAHSYHQAGMATLQFNFTGHGEGTNKSDGTLKDITLSSGVQDIKAVWDYAQTSLPDGIDKRHVALNANSYGALVTLLALEQRLISPESMISVAPFDFNKFKAMIIPLWVMMKLIPDEIPKILKLPIAPEMVSDFLNHYTKGISRKDLLGNTAAYFFVGAEDRVSSSKTIQRWAQRFNAHKPKDIDFVDHIQVHQKIYPHVKHFKIPEEVRRDMQARSIEFILKTRAIRIREE